MANARSIVVAGSLNADLVVGVPRFPRPGETLAGTGFAQFPGGKGANQAYAAARLGGAVRLVGQVGQDDLGTWLLDHLASARVDVRAVGRDPGVSTGLAIITVDATGQNSIVLVPGANGTFVSDHLATAGIEWGSTRVLLLQLEIPLETVLAAARAARAAGSLVLLDPAPARDVPDELLALSDYVTPNESELGSLTGGGTVDGEDDLVRRAQALRARGAGGVIVKWGERGAVLVGERIHHWPAHRVRAVDTTAAGDAFNGALAVGLADGHSIEDAGRMASAAAALSVTRQGAQTSMPTLEEVRAFTDGAR